MGHGIEGHATSKRSDARSAINTVQAKRGAVVTVQAERSAVETVQANCSAVVTRT